MSQRRSFVTLTLNPEKNKIATKITWSILLRNIKLKHKYFILGLNTVIKINW